MARIEYDDVDIKEFKKSAEGRSYLDYNDKVGGEPLCMMVPFGYPEGFEKYGSVIAVYEACIREGKTWEELLGFKPPDDADI